MNETKTSTSVGTRGIMVGLDILQRARCGRKCEREGVKIFVTSGTVENCRGARNGNVGNREFEEEMERKDVRGAFMNQPVTRWGPTDGTDPQ